MGDCATCAGHGFVKRDDEVVPCPRCNSDSGYGVGEYEIEMVKKHGRCGYAKGGGGRSCYLHRGHKGRRHYFQCGM